jgi:hypothetical protein
VARSTISATDILLAIRLVQPGRLQDVAEGLRRLLPYEIDIFQIKPQLASRLQSFREAEFVCLYQGQRYMLTQLGRDYISDTGIKLQIDDRRMYLLKETRRANPKLRSGARDGSLQQ